MTSVDPKARWRKYVADAQHESSSAIDLNAAVAGSMTIEPLVPYLGAHLLTRNVKPRITVGPFNQLRQICQDYGTVLGCRDLHAIALLWRIEDLFPDMLTRCLEEPGAVPELLHEVKSLAGDVTCLRKAFNGIVVVSTPPYPTTPGFEVSDLRQASSGMAIFHAISHCWADAIAQLERVRLLDLHGMMLKTGLTKAHDARKWMLYRQPYAEEFWAEIGRMLGRILLAEKTSPKKCVVLDLDNTLWGGIVGEDGIEGIQLGEEFPGRAYRDFQRHLLCLKRKGVLLAVASKNNPDDAYAVFDTHDAMVLSRTDIAAFEIHWDSKVESLERIARTLNIGVDSLVFVDDSPKEIGEVMERLPEVTCVTVPEELAHLPALLAETDYFDFTEVTDEDRQRTEMIAADTLRRQTEGTMSEEEFRSTLNLRINVYQAQRQHLGRVTQLINKTNQFNLTTIRRTRDEVESLANSGDAVVLAMDIQDKYGDYGLVGVSILKKENSRCIIDTLLMSCRVLGRGAEQALIAAIIEAATSLECDELRGKYIPTPRNNMVKDLYERFDFAYDARSGDWLRSINRSIPESSTLQGRSAVAD